MQIQARKSDKRRRVTEEEREEEERQEEEGKVLVSGKNCVAGNIQEDLAADPEPPRVAAPTTRIYLFSAFNQPQRPCLATPRLPTANSCISAAYITTSTNSHINHPKIGLSVEDA